MQGKLKVECCKKSQAVVEKFIEETSGTSNQDMCDFTFVNDGVSYAVDTKL